MRKKREPVIEPVVEQEPVNYTTPRPPTVELVTPEPFVQINSLLNEYGRPVRIDLSAAMELRDGLQEVLWQSLRRNG